MHIDHGVPLLVGHTLDHVVPGVARVVHDDVDSAERVNRGLDEAIAEVGVGHAADTGHGFSAGFA
ncbi:hypothetical protein D3C86_1822150 [compost metagenome]